MEIFELIDKIEEANCTCGAGTDRCKPGTWAFCGTHSQLAMLRGSVSDLRSKLEESERLRVNATECANAADENLDEAERQLAELREALRKLKEKYHVDEEDWHIDAC